MKGGLDEFVRVRREAGRSWRLIERDLYQLTKGKVDVSFETLRAWFPQYGRAGNEANGAVA